MQSHQAVPGLSAKMVKHISMLAKNEPRYFMDGRTLNALARRDLAKKLKRGDWKLLAAGRKHLR